MTEENVEYGSTYEKKYHELTFTDNFLFCKIMEKNHELCRRLLEIILNVKIKKIVLADREHTLGVTPEGKSVRLDVYVEDESGTVYNIEMQVSAKKNLPKRTRYYQGMIDLNLIEKGADYNELKKTYVIFICIFDPFGKGLPIYSFTNKCSEMPELELGDDTAKIFVNADGDSEYLTPDMRAFLKLLKENAPEGNQFTDDIQKAVESARKCEEWRVEYMSLMMEFRQRYNEGRMEGRMEGRAESKAEDIIELLEEVGTPSASLKKLIMEQNKIELLKQWLRLAARAESIESFEQKIGLGNPNNESK